jgi:hypothetical protein
MHRSRGGEGRGLCLGLHTSSCGRAARQLAQVLAVRSQLGPAATLAREAQEARPLSADLSQPACSSSAAS